MTFYDHHLLIELGDIGKIFDCFYGDIPTNSLSVVEQLDFRRKLVAAAGRIRERVETMSVDHFVRQGQ